MKERTSGPFWLISYGDYVIKGQGSKNKHIFGHI